MDSAEQLEKQLIFEYIINHLNYDKKKFSETGKAYIESAKDFFNKITYGLKSIINPKQEYFLVDNLKKIHEVIGGKKQFTKRSIEDTIQKINKTQKQLDKLVENPKDFYQSEDSQELLTLCRNISDIYKNDVILFSKPLN